ncbi:excalibur calcium-binding domain-containing protein [Alkanindiges illinoisensis]|uniref:Excalibur calcium-binding domain-containing protein n=2 Tax=Alkanindiges illinoisensis TaxID=197183 RepID=A0A4Y7X8T7_9GAMM|nr:excalibur calcium-binding domain-containing protein [Alkanindiges illinoisensis]
MVSNAIAKHSSTLSAKSTSGKTLVPKTSEIKCRSYPRTCGAMTSCQQARQALKCGNDRLDRDGDGIPCESICGD